MPTSWRSNLQTLLAVCWLILPPLWFILEWHMYKPKPTREDFERFKYNQDRARDVWVGIAAALAIVFGLKG